MAKRNVVRRTRTGQLPRFTKGRQKLLRRFSEKSPSRSTSASRKTFNTIRVQGDSVRRRVRKRRR